jgi:integrase
MTKKSGQARVPKPQDWDRLYLEISKHRYPEKNTAIMQISQKLGLRVQEIALLEFKEVCKLFGQPGAADRKFKLFEVMTLPASYTKGANATKRSASSYNRRKISFKVEEFDQILRQVTKLVLAGAEVTPEDYYPVITEHKGTARDLPLVDDELNQSIIAYIELRLAKDPYIKPSDPLFITQKGGSYSPNTLQEHMALMLRDWAGIEKASSHSGRRNLITDIIHNQKKSLKVAQKIAGHKAASTTVIYEEPPEEEISDALANVGNCKK